METIYDWVTLGIFAGLVVLFLQRSTAETDAKDSLVWYLAAGVGCGLTNYLGNKGADVPAVLTLVATLGQGPARQTRRGGSRG